MDGDGWSESRREIESKDKRIKELEDGMRYMKSLNSAMLKAIVDCSKMVLNCYASLMGQRDAEIEAVKLSEKYQFGKEDAN